MSVRRARREISSREFSDWRAYDRWDPIGQVRGDLNAATIAAAIYNSRRRKSSDRVARVEQFMPTFYRPRRRLTPKAMFDAVRAMNAMFGGEFVEKDA